ncbi:MAG: dihydroorotate dehydrogenase electron transfer subunit [bacterium]|nr:dihydroorotate dehydrogenase electron transfer subunit [bacterium]
MTSHIITTQVKTTAQLTSGKIVQKRMILADVFKLSLEHSRISRLSQPGQFVNIKVSDHLTPLLRRPFSITAVNAEAGRFEILFKVIGEGTMRLSRLEPGEMINLIGPLGNSFSISSQTKRALLVAGGLGIAPLAFLLQHLSQLEIKKTLFWGNQTKALFLAYPEIKHSCLELFYTTDDGSMGYHGLVTDFFAEEIPKFEHEAVQIFACGPNPMLKKIQQVATQHGIDCQLSLETLMGCGFGACMGCNVQSASGESYFYTCSDGPVFNAKDIKVDG